MLLSGEEFVLSFITFFKELQRGWVDCGGCSVGFHSIFAYEALEGLNVLWLFYQGKCESMYIHS